MGFVTGLYWTVGLQGGMCCVLLYHFMSIGVAARMIIAMCELKFNIWHDSKSEGDNVICVTEGDMCDMCD